MGNKLAGILCYCRNLHLCVHPLVLLNMLCKMHIYTLPEAETEPKWSWRTLGMPKSYTVMQILDY